MRAAAGDPDVGRWARWADAWSLLLRGAYGDAAQIATEVEHEAARARDAALVIEAASIRALATAASGDLAEATTLARRASRMARTEAIPEQEWIAHLVLARVRRLTGHPHLATRILTALARVAGPDFQPWLRWELAMAGAVETAVEQESTRPSHARDLSNAAELGAAWLVELCQAADAADAHRFDQAAAALEQAVRWPMLAEEVAAALDACDVRRAPRDAAVRAWCAGATHDGPPLLHGLLTRAGSAPEDETAIAYVLVHPTYGCRRVPRMGYALFDRRGITILEQGRRKQGRVETVVSALALAPGMELDEPACFADVYGFAFEPEVHRGVFGVLLHRAREYLGGAGSIEAGGGRIRMTLATPILVPDPRCTKPMQDRLLRTVAQHGKASAKDVAKALGLSLRVAQTALAELSADGACVAHREGREVRYEVEDTTFSEPTQVG